MSGYHALLATLLCTVTLAAQGRTHLVGPGGHATLQAAVDAAISGDTIEVQGPFFGMGSTVIHNKSLWIRTRDRSWLGPLSWSSTNAGQYARLSGFRLMFWSDCSKARWGFSGPGTVLMEDCTGSGRIGLSGCSRACLRACTMDWRVCGGTGWGPSLIATDVVALHLDSCSFGGASGNMLNRLGDPAIVIERSVVELQSTNAAGGIGYQHPLSPRSADGPGIDAKGSIVRITGTPNESISSLNFHALLVQDSRIEFSGVRIEGPTGQLGLNAMRTTGPLTQVIGHSPRWPHVTTRGFVMGQNTVVEVGGGPGRPVVLFFAERTTLQVAPFGPIWVDVTSLWFPVLVVLDATGAGTTQVPVGLAPQLLGQQLFVQAFEFDAQLAIRSSGLSGGVIGN